MAVLNQSELWPIHSARRLHDKAQLRFMWQFFIPNIGFDMNQDIMMLAQSCVIPGVEFDHETYSVGGQEYYYLTKSRRGGQVTARFVETEGGKVDRFFRTWASNIDVPRIEPTAIGRWRRPKGRGAAIVGHARTAVVRLLTRAGGVGVEFLLSGLQFKGFGPFDLSYQASEPLVVPVMMICDEVIRRS